MRAMPSTRLHLATCMVTLAVACAGCEPSRDATQRWLEEHAQGLDAFAGRLKRAAESIRDPGQDTRALAKELDPPFVECKCDYRDQACNALFVSLGWARDPTTFPDEPTLFMVSSSGPSISLRNLKEARAGKVFEEERLNFNHRASIEQVEGRRLNLDSFRLLAVLGPAWTDRFQTFLPIEELPCSGRSDHRASR
ncbi:MAG: hypothetical protein JXR96_17085 [Deltaproteobacteria bacterium]|nr:hypothetical protein [Deltaproteobacteria bacterium]